MKTISAKWFECKVRFDQVQEDGTAKKVTEQYVVDALSFTEAEARITEEVTPYINGEFEVTHIAIAAYKNVSFTDDEKADKWYKAKVAFITLDEKTAKEKRFTVQMLIKGSSLNNAISNIDEVMRGSMMDYVSVDAKETKIMDVFTFKAGKDDEQD